MKSFLVATMVLAAAVSSGCGSAEGSPGTAEFTVWGEEFIEEEIPADEFADGWSVKFDTFLIVVGDIAVSGSAGEGGELAGTHLFDLVTPGPHDVGSLELDSGPWEHVGFETPVIDADTVTDASASEEGRALMEGGPYAVYVAGKGTRDAQEVAFAWGFTEGVAYGDCVAEVDGREVPGFRLPSGGSETVQLTIHGDHFFYDDLASEEAGPRFQAIADADADGDGSVTLEELSAVNLVDVSEGPYGTGGLSDVDDLGAFVTAQTRTLGHYRGEGHCVAQ